MDLVCFESSKRRARFTRWQRKRLKKRKRNPANNRPNNQAGSSGPDKPKAKESPRRSRPTRRPRKKRRRQRRLWRREKAKPAPRPPADPRLKVLKKFHGKFLPRGATPRPSQDTDGALGFGRRPRWRDCRGAQVAVQRLENRPCQAGQSDRRFTVIGLVRPRPFPGLAAILGRRVPDRRANRATPEAIVLGGGPCRRVWRRFHGLTRLFVGRTWRLRRPARERPGCNAPRINRAWLEAIARSIAAPPRSRLQPGRSCRSARPGWLAGEPLSPSAIMRGPDPARRDAAARSRSGR